jgi:hypothetical protein
MKTNLLRTSILAVVTAAAVYGQSSQILKVSVPFDFVVGTKTLRAGQYTVDQGPVSRAAIIKSADHKRGVIVVGTSLQSLDPQKDGKLVFHRYGDTYFLIEVWGAGNYGRQVPKTRRERELAARRLPPESSTLVASR